MDKKRAIELLKQKSKEAVYIASLPYNNNEYLPWRRNIEDILEETFGITSTEYKRVNDVRVRTKGTPDVNQRIYVTTVHRIQQEVDSIIQKHDILCIESKPVLEHEIPISPITLYEAMQLHPRITRASKSLFHSGHYAEAIFAAFKAVNNFTKRKTGQSLDGKDLMAKVFNEDKPIIKLNKLVTRSERDEQEGFRFLYMGAMVGIRNPKAHDDIRQINPYKALEYLAFASLLMRRVIEGKLEPKETQT
jgi:uncharacterized protein (TIGR02391 family)